MATLATMRTRISNYLNRADLNAEIDLAINRAIEYYEKERFYFHEAIDTFVTIANQESYGTADTLPADIKEIDEVIITLAGTNKPPLNERTYNFIKELNVGASTGTPEDYAWYASKIWLYPIPNAVWTITLSYKKSYAALTLDADTNDWTTKAEDLIENHAMWQLQEQLLKDFEAADRTFTRIERFYLPAMRKKSNQLLATNQIKHTDF